MNNRKCRAGWVDETPAGATEVDEIHGERRGYWRTARRMKAFFHGNTAKSR